MFFHNESLQNSIWAGNSSFIVAYLLGVIICFIKRKEYPRLFFAFVPNAAISLIVIYNPMLYSFITRYFLDQDAANSIYGRLCALWFVFPIVAGSGVLLIDSLRQNKERICLVAIIVLYFIAALRTDDSYRPLFIHVDPYYKMTDTAVDICEEIVKSEDDEIKVLLLEDEDITSDLAKEKGDEYYIYNDLLEMTGEYTARIKKDVMSIKKSNKLTGDDSIMQYKYIICYADESKTEILLNMGYEIVYEKGAVKLMRN